MWGIHVFDTREEVLSLTKRLVSMESIVNTAGEKVIARSLYELISSFDYFEKNPDQVMPGTNESMTIEKDIMCFVFVKGTKKEE